MAAGAMGAEPRLDHDGCVALLHLGDGENRLNCQSIAAIQELLDEVERGPSTALVTSAVGKFWCNGMDTPWIQAHPERAVDVFLDAERLLGRLLGFPVRTVAALQGHAYAAGFLLALAHDTRLMRADRGWMCLPEITFGAVFTQGMTDLIHERLGPEVARRAVMLAERFDGPQAVENRIVEETVDADRLLGHAIEIAQRPPIVNRQVMAATKANLHARALATLAKTPACELLVAAVLAC